METKLGETVLHQTDGLQLPKRLVSESSSREEKRATDSYNNSVQCQLWSESTSRIWLNIAQTKGNKRQHRRGGWREKSIGCRFESHWPCANSPPFQKRSCFSICTSRSDANIILFNTLLNQISSRTPGENNERTSGPRLSSCQRHTRSHSFDTEHSVQHTTKQGNSSQKANIVSQHDLSLTHKWK